MTLCATPESLRAAVQALAGHTHVFLDCEGQTLGVVGGKLSLLNLGVVDRDRSSRLQTFLIEVLAFQGSMAQQLNPIFDLLRSEQVFKVVFDGRMDASELLNGHGVQLKNALDLQVADIASREQHESVDRRLQRLVGFLPQYEVNRNRALYLQVQRLNGLDYAMIEHGVHSGGKGYVDHDKWLQRPLSQASLHYAADDIRKIWLLYNKFVEKGYISNGTLTQQTARYLALHGTTRHPRNDKYKSHGLFPLGILSGPVSGATVRCQGCRRDLPISAFSCPSHPSNGFCFVCRAINSKNGGTVTTTSFRRRIIDYDDLYNDFDNEDLYNDFDDDDYFHYGRGF